MWPYTCTSRRRSILLPYLPPFTPPEMCLCFGPPCVIPVRSSPLLCCTHDHVPATRRMELFSSHLLLLHYPQHSWFWRLCGRYSPVITSTHLQRHHYIAIPAMFFHRNYCWILNRLKLSFNPLQIITQTKSTQSGTVSSWLHGSFSAWPGCPCLSITPLTSWSRLMPTSNISGVDRGKRIAWEHGVKTRTDKRTKTKRPSHQDLRPEWSRNINTQSVSPDE